MSKLTAKITVNPNDITKAAERAINHMAIDLGADIPKPWGKEVILEHNDDYVIKELHVNKGERLSLQYHENKRETIMCQSGYGRLFVSGEYIAMTEGEKFTVEPYEIHRLESHPQHDLVLLEISTKHLGDIVRVEDDYGRV